MQQQTTTPPEAVTYSGSSIVTLSGGYNNNWNGQAGANTIVDTVTIVSGTLIFDGIVIQ